MKPLQDTKQELCLLPLRDAVLFPNMVVPLFIGRDKSIRAVDEALKQESNIFLVTQKEMSVENPTKKDLYSIGTISKIIQILKLPDGTLKVLIEGLQRAAIWDIHDDGQVLSCVVQPREDNERELVDQGIFTTSEGDHVDVQVLLRALDSQFTEYAKLNEKLSSDVLGSMRGLSYPGRLADLISIHLPLSIEHKQNILETIDVHERVELVLSYLQKEMEWLRVEKNIQKKVRDQIAEDQKKYFNREKLKAIQQELGEMEGDGGDIKTLLAKVKSLKLPKDTYEKVESEVNKLALMPPMSAESTVIRNWLDWVIDLPWNKKSKTKNTLSCAREILDEDHFGLDKVKERIIEYLAVLKRVKKVRGSIICLVGPPGVGKTSLGQSIARALGRSFVRISLGGVRDEAEIRGHRKTYIGAMPGRLIKAMKRAKVKNPLIMFDEIDKMGMDYRGDPASALLEVLDQEQNYNFVDHYLELDYDLSDVMFITTANTLDIPAPLLDRMELIRIAGYTEQEKLNIAKDYLIPKAAEACGLKVNEMQIDDALITHIIQSYTREAGVRELERLFMKIGRKIIKKQFDIGHKMSALTSKDIRSFLGAEKFDHGVVKTTDQIGLVRGMAWSQVGGDLLMIEALTMPGKGDLIYTGSLGEVMQESVKTAKSVARVNIQDQDVTFYQKTDIHVHVPEGATPKDGPSAGIAICTAIISTIKQQPVDALLSMTGELTLRGEVLPIGGLKEKLLAAHRGGIKRVIIPKKNERDLEEVPEEIRQDLKIFPVTSIDEVLKIALK
ncbi:MAG: endopeptidase La [Legionellales bacterium]|nr:endopeptidase La [Legionellales bacterium]